jgi:hypothetical protein
MTGVQKRTILATKMRWYADQINLLGASIMIIMILIITDGSSGSSNSTITTTIAK